MKKQFHAIKKMLPKLAKQSDLALAAKKYTETVALWKALLQAVVDARETDHLNTHVTKICNAIQNHVTATIPFNKELHQFINASYSCLISFLSDLHHKELPVSTIKAHLVDTHPVHIVVLEKYCNLLAEAAIFFYEQKNYNDTTMSLLGAIKQLTAYSDLAITLQKLDPKSSVLASELDIARMRQAIYYSICIKCRRLDNPQVDITLLQSKGIEAYKKVSSDDRKDNLPYTNMKKIMQGFVWLMCTEKLADPNNQIDEYYSCKTRGLELLWRLLLVGTPKLDFLFFDDIKNTAETLHESVQDLISTNHLSTFRMSRLEESRFILQEILFGLQLDNHDMVTLEKNYTEMARIANVQRCNLNVETSAFYHYRTAALLLSSLDISNACIQISLAKRYAQQINDNPLIPLRIQITAMMIEVIDSVFTALPETIAIAHEAFKRLSTTAEQRPHIKALFIHYRETLAVVFHFYINLQIMYNPLNLKAFCYAQGSDIELKLEEVRCTMQGKPYTAPLQNNHEDAPPTSNLPITTEPEPRTTEELFQVANDLLHSLKPQSCLKLINKFWHLLDEQPYFIAQAHILVCQCQIEISTAIKGIHQQQAQINIALQTCEKALTIARGHNLLPHINSIFYVLCDVQNSLDFAIQQIELRAKTFALSIPKPLDQLELSSPYGLIYKSFGVHKSGFKKLMHQCEKLQFAIDTHKYEFTAQHPEYKLPNHQLRYALGVQVFFPKKIIRSNSVGSFDGYIEPKSYNPRF